MQIKTALISVYDKTGIVEFAKELQLQGIKILSTGGTASLLMENNIPVIKLEDYTGIPEMLDGRVKTLCYQVFSGLLCKRDNESHVQQLKDKQINFIDMVIVNLYPFEEMMKKRLSLDEMIEYIDIGGNSLLRAASKNYKFVLPVSQNEDYQTIINYIKNKEEIPEDYRLQLAKKTFFFTSYYDSLIAQYFSQQTENTQYTQKKTIFLEKLQGLRYGENPHQTSGLYTYYNNKNFNFQQLHGKELSFNNIVDFWATANIVADLDKCFKKVACVIVKHRNPCGVALADNNFGAYKKALQTDPVSAFGGIIAFNAILDLKTAKEINKRFYEIVVAKDFKKDAVKELQKKKNLRIIKIEDYALFLKENQVINSYDNLVLIQSKDIELFKELKNVTKMKITKQAKDELKFAWIICKYVKSNAIVLTKNFQLRGVGAGQMSRIDSVNIALMKAKKNGFKVEGTYLASDAYFPFDDSIKQAHKHKIKAIIQPGGSINDNKVIQKANELKIPMVFTGMRHFYH